MKLATSIVRICVILPPLSMEGKFLGNCFGHSERMPDETESGFFVGRVLPVKADFVDRKKVNGVIEIVPITVGAQRRCAPAKG
jgi:hypothetical protein